MRMQQLSRKAVALIVVALVAAPWVAADAPPGPYFNGFETDTAGWFNFSGGTITRVPSGSIERRMPTGVPAAHGSYYARLGIDPSPDSCTFGGGTAPIYYGPYHKLGRLQLDLPSWRISDWR